jgi:hypothetical protein
MFEEGKPIGRWSRTNSTPHGDLAAENFRLRDDWYGSAERKVDDVQLAMARAIFLGGGVSAAIIGILGD